MNKGSVIATLALASLALNGLAQTDTTGTHSAEGYFNRASRQYVKEDKSSAMRILDEGLRAHPGDAKLLKLAEQLLKEERQNQQQQQQQQPEQQQQQQQEQEQQQRQGHEREQGQEKERSDEGMDKRDAERMLDELNRKEQGVQDRVRSRSTPSRKPKPAKDW
ncbi:MAG TPA: hypothetical protein PKY96_13210 [Flavobacteriales bacterium]|nr:hypothetical protein [Flavobacteriales bacterium]